jgi:hypothetical protein
MIRVILFLKKRASRLTESIIGLNSFGWVFQGIKNLYAAGHFEKTPPERHQEMPCHIH